MMEVEAKRFVGTDVPVTIASPVTAIILCNDSYQWGHHFVGKQALPTNNITRPNESAPNKSVGMYLIYLFIFGR